MFLEELPVFGSLNRDHLTILSRLARAHNYASGSVILKQGSDTNDLFLIRTGFVRLLRRVKVDEESRERINKVSEAVSATSQDLDAILSPRRHLPKLNLKV